MKSYFFDRELRIDENVITFEQRIVKTIELDGTVFVLLNGDDFASGDELVGQNIVAYDSNGKFIWRIERHGFKVPNRGGVEVPQAYFGLWIGEDGKTLHAGIPVAEFEVDPANGMLQKVELDRW
jgi:hypothetical protein